MFRKKPAVPTVDSGPMDHNGAVASGTAPAPPVNPGAAVPPGFPEVFDLLFKGLPGTLGKVVAGKHIYSSIGYLSVKFENSLTFTPTNPIRKWTPIKMSDILNVELEVRTNGRREKTPGCRVLVKGGDSFSFASKDGAAGRRSRAEVAALVAAVIKDKLDPLHPIESTLKNARMGRKPPTGPRASTFAELLEPLGLVDEYCLAFNESGILLEDLGVVTRRDLAELVGMTDRRHLIKVMAQIKRCFPSYPPCCCGSGGSNHYGVLEKEDPGVSAIKQGADAMGSVADLVNGIIGMVG